MVFYSRAIPICALPSHQCRFPYHGVFAIHFGEDVGSENQEALQSSVREAVDNVISQEVGSILAEILEEFSDVLRIRLGKVSPSDVPLMVIDVKDSARQVRSDQCRYPQAKCKLIEPVTRKFLEYVFLKTSIRQIGLQHRLLYRKHRQPTSSYRLSYVRPCRFLKV